MNDLQYAGLKRVVQRRLGLDLDAYKPDQMRRRIENFERQHATAGTEMFLHTLDADPGLMGKLAAHLTINVTEFFRDPQMHQGLLARITERTKPGILPLRIWSAGCSNAAEAYSLCIAFTESLPQLRFSILATDFDSGILEEAKNGGPYPANELKQVPPNLMAKYFEKEKDQARFTHPVRQRVSFKKHDLLRDPYEAGFDVIMCRNVMIYFTPEARRRVTRGFMDALKPGGLFFLGSSEALMSSDGAGFRAAGSCLYEKLPVRMAQPVLKSA